MQINETLYSVTKSGKFQIWKIESFENGKIKVTFGLEEGKLQEKITTVMPKNIGKVNETTLGSQALLEAKSMINSQLDKGYRFDKEKAIEAVMNAVTPQLAQDFLKPLNQKKILWEKGVFVQPKLDGIRSLCERKDSTNILSRKRKIFPENKVLFDQIRTLMNELDLKYLDGELYIHGEDFQSLISAIKKPEGNVLTNKLEFWIFDVPNQSTYSDVIANDFKKINEVIKSRGLTNIKVIESKLVYSLEEAKVLMDGYLRAGYEGVMLRNKDMVYSFSERSYDLQKYKLFFDEEFKIVDVIPDKDSNGIYVCTTKEGKLFNVTPKATHQAKKMILESKSDFIGEMLTVKFQEYSQDQIPRFGVGINVRDFE